MAASVGQRRPRLRGLVVEDLCSERLVSDWKRDRVHQTRRWERCTRLDDQRLEHGVGAAGRDRGRRLRQVLRFRFPRLAPQIR